MKGQTTITMCIHVKTHMHYNIRDMNNYTLISDSNEWFVSSLETRNLPAALRHNHSHLSHLDSNRDGSLPKQNPSQLSLDPCLRRCCVVQCLMCNCTSVIGEKIILKKSLNKQRDIELSQSGPQEAIKKKS